MRLPVDDLGRTIVRSGCSSETELGEGNDGRLEAKLLGLTPLLGVNETFGSGKAVTEEVVGGRFRYLIVAVEGVLFGSGNAAVGESARILSVVCVESGQYCTSDIGGRDLCGV